MKRVGLLLAVALASPAAAETLGGRAAWAAGDWAKAVAEYRGPAQAGDPEAQMGLGEAYRLGRGVVADAPTALGWYRKAADQNYGRAVDALGLMLFATGQRREAVPYLERGVDRGDPRVLYVLGTAHFNGDYVARDRGLAFAMMTRAANAGLAQAKSSLAQMDKYMFPADRARAQTLLAKAPAAPAKPTAVALSKVPLPVKAPVRSAEPSSKPELSPTRSAAVETTAKGTLRVQIGAYGSAERARAGWTALVAKVPQLSRYEPRVVDAGKVQRLQATGLPDRAAVTSLCRALTSAGAGCLPVGS